MDSFISASYFGYSLRQTGWPVTCLQCFHYGYCVKRTVIRFRVDAPKSGSPISASSGQKRYPSRRKSLKITSLYAPVSVIIWYGISVCCSRTTARMTRLSLSVPGTTMSFIPEYWSDIRLYHVTPRPSLNYLGLGPACTVCTGTTNRIPSADATSPPPQRFARGTSLCAATRIALAARIIVSVNGAPY